MREQFDSRDADIGEASDRLGDLIDRDGDRDTEPEGLRLVRITRLDDDPD